MAEQREAPLQRLLPNILGRLLHQQLWQRLSTFCAEHTPDIPAEGIVGMWLQRFYANDASIIILARLNNEMQITEHALAELQALPGYNIIHLYQTQLDKAIPGHLDEIVEAIEKLGLALGCTFFVARTHEHVRVYERKFGFKPMGTTLIKSLLTEPADAVDTEDQ